MMEEIVTYGSRGKRIYLACIDCGKQKQTKKERYSSRCVACARVFLRKSVIVIEGKKQCTQCNEWIDLSLFYKQKTCPGGLRPECKTCSNKRIANCHAEVPLLRRLWSRISRIRNKEKNAVTKKLYIQNNKEKIDKRVKAYREANKETIKRKNREIYLRDPSKAMERLRKRKAAILGAGGFFTESDWREVLNRYGNACLKCGSRDNIVRDHVIPVSKGGMNDKYNIQPLCQHCNAVKWSRDWDFRFDKGDWSK
jgi:5-methylcytosine-specific restriction endonuclease McrA